MAANLQSWWNLAPETPWKRQGCTPEWPKPMCHSCSMSTLTCYSSTNHKKIPPRSATCKAGSAFLPKCRPVFHLETHPARRWPRTTEAGVLETLAHQLFLTDEGAGGESGRFFLGKRSIMKPDRGVRYWPAETTAHTWCQGILSHH